MPAAVSFFSAVFGWTLHKATPAFFFIPDLFVKFKI